MAKLIKIKDVTYDELTELGGKKETYDDIIRKLLDFYKNSKNPPQSKKND